VDHQGPYRRSHPIRNPPAVHQARRLDHPQPRRAQLFRQPLRRAGGLHLERLDDSDESRVIRWGGAGTDNGDKAFAKAGTNALKEMLKKVFLVTDRDDAKEETESVEHQTDDGARKADLIKAREEKAGAIQQWAKTFKAALETAKTGKDIDRLQRENKAQLTDESLPDVTRDFFVDLIQERKKALGDV
jgi:predicted ATP-dependent endonuclease of OLD family